MRISFRTFNIFMVIFGILLVSSWALQIYFIFSAFYADISVLTVVNVFFTLIYYWLLIWSVKKISK